MQEPGTKGLKNNVITVEIKTKKQHNQQEDFSARTIDQTKHCGTGERNRLYSHLSTRYGGGSRNKINV